MTDVEKPDAQKLTIVCTGCGQSRIANHRSTCSRPGSWERATLHERPYAVTDKRGRLI